jgi:hypothetical protein
VGVTDANTIGAGVRELAQFRFHGVGYLLRAPGVGVAVVRKQELRLEIDHDEEQRGIWEYIVDEPGLVVVVERTFRTQAGDNEYRDRTVGPS